jgi:hypothetical protein
LRDERMYIRRSLFLIQFHLLRFICGRQITGSQSVR